MFHYVSSFFQRWTISASINLMSAHVQQFGTLRAPAIMLEMEGAIAEVYSMSSLPNNEFSESIFEKEDPIKGF